MKTNIIFPLLILVSIAGLAGRVPAQTSCDINAAINNGDSKATTDASGTNVRSGPGKDFGIVKTLTSRMGFVFHITASKGQWVRISSVNMVDGQKPNRLDGWIYAPSLFMKFDSGDKGRSYGKLFTSPDLSSRAVLSAAQMKRKESNIVSLLECKGTWARVSWQGTEGWLPRGDQCTEMWDICGER